MGEGIVLADIEGRFHLVNREAFRLVGVKIGDCTPSDEWSRFYGIYKPDRVTLFKDEELPLRRSIRGLKTQNCEMYVRNSHARDGIYLNVNGSPVFDRDNNLIGGIIVFQDITQTRLAAEALLEKKDDLERKFLDSSEELFTSSAQFETFFNSCPLGFAFVDSELRFSRVNEVLANLNGIAAEDHRGCAVRDLMPDFIPHLAEAVRYVMETGKPILNQEVSLTTRKSPNETLDFLCSYYPVQGNGRTLGVGVILSEVTERKRTQLKLEESEKRFKLVARATNDGLWDWDLKNDSVWWGENIYNLFGYSSPEVYANIRWWYENLHPEDRDRVIHGIHAVIRGGRNYWTDEYRFRRTDNTYAYVLDRGYVAYNEKKEPVRMIGAIMDITARRLAEETHSRLAAIVEYCNDAIISLTFEGRIVSWNSSAEKIYGYTFAEVENRGCSFLAPPGREEEDFTLIEQVLAGVRVEDFETQRLRKDGRQIDVSKTMSLIKNSAGDNTGISLIVRDITERKRMRKQMEVQAQILAQVSDAVVATDPEGKITYLNGASEALFGVTSQRAIGCRVEEIGHCQWLNPIANERLREILKVEGSFQAEKQLDCMDGQRVHLESSISVLRDLDGSVLGFLEVFRDVTPRKQAEERLKLQTQELVRSNQELVQFAYVASHDLKEPLRMVTNFVRLLERKYKGKLDQEADEFINYAVDGALRMYELINDLLAYSRVGTRREPFHLTNLNEVLESVTSNLSVSIAETGARVHYTDLPVVVADPIQMVQLLQNLISNAIKFRGREAPLVQISAEQREKDWLLQVKDNGIGIDPRFSERIFIIFQRLHSRDEYPGTGIGLAICKRIIERHGGKIWVESCPTGGSVFSFTLPFREISPGEQRRLGRRN